VSAPPGFVPLPALDDLDTDEAIAALAPLFEGAPHFLARLAAKRPFGDETGLFAKARAIAHLMPEAEQVELIEAHPRLGAPPGSVSALSFREQGYDEEAADAAAETERVRVQAELDRLNAEYEATFAFRYCVFVAGRPRAALLPEMEAATRADRFEEIHRALDAVVDIAADRYHTLAG
jgi:2-oxo-4-hydroxy-4-carboxy--5-ureidoimidazoline (OHCU) decarboxylase